MADQRIDQLNAETTPAAVDLLPVFSIAGADTKKITVKNLIQVGAALIDNGSIPGAKVNLSALNIVNANIDANAEISVSKLADGSARQLLQTDAAGTGVEWASNIDIPGTLDVTSAATFDSNVAVTGTLTKGGSNVVTVGDSGTVTSAMLLDGTILDADIASAAEIAVSKLADGLARQLLQTDTAGTGVEWASNIDIPGTLDVTSAATFDSTVAVTGTLTRNGSNVVTVGDSGTVTSAMLLNGTIVDADISASAEIAVSKLADGSARQLLQTDAAGTDVEWASNIDIPGTLDVTNAATFDSTVAVAGALTKSGSNVVTVGDTGTVTSAMLLDGTILDADISASAEIAVSKLADGSARQLLQTDAAGTGVEWASNIDIPGTLDVTSAATFDSNVAVTGTLTKGGSNVVTVGDSGTVTSAMLLDGTILDADISANAEISVSKLADGSARQLLQTDATGTGVEWASNIAIPGTLNVTSAATFDSNVAVTGTLTRNGSNVVTVGDTGTVTSAMLSLNGVIVNADINANAEISVSKLADGSARQLLQTDAAGTGVEWASNIDIPGTLDVTSAATFDSNVSVTGTLTRNGSNVVTVGDTGTVTSAMLSLNGVIVNADINASAAIAYSKLATLANGNIVLGSNGVATSTAVTGDVTISNTGVTAIASGVIVDADINASAGIAYSKLAALTSGNIILGNNSVATSTTVTGDITISNTGVTAISSGVIVNADIDAAAAIVDTKLATISTAGKVSNSSTTATDANTASSIVARNASGNFSAGTITAALAGTASGNLVSGGVLGTPSSGTLTSCTGLPISTGVSGLGTGAATFLTTPSSANLAALLTDETGTGAAVFATSPTLVSPVLGTPASGILTNCTGLPIATASVVGAMLPGTGLTVTGGGVVNHTNSVTAATRSGITFDAQGHITTTIALVGGDLPAATSSVKGAVRPGTGLTVDGSGILDISAATNIALGGVIAGSDFGISTGTISLATQGGLTAGTYTKATFNSKGIATGGTALVAGDIPNLAASQITSGSLDIARIATNTVTSAKLANYAVTKIGDTQPTADHIGEFFFNPLSRDLFLWDGNVYQPIGISVGEIVFAGTFDASLGSGTGLISSVTTEGTAIGLAIGQALPAAAAGNSRYYLVVAEGGTITTGNAPHVVLAPPDILLSNGITWAEIDISQTITAQVASNVSFAPAGSIVAVNVQTAIQELDGDKLAVAGGTITGNLEIGAAGSLSFEGATANAFETTIALVDPTADRTITLPDTTGTVITTGDTGTVTSTMLLDGTILNADVNASAGIVDTKLATIATAGKVSNSATTATDSNTASAIVSRNASGNFSAGTITAALAGTASNVTTNANLTGHITSVGNAAVLGSFTSAQLLAALTDETGTGAAVFAASPTLITPVLGTPASGTLTNCTFPTLNQSTTGNAATVTTNANLAGDVTSVGNTTSIAAGVIVNANINASAAIAGSKIVAATTSVVGAVQLSDSISTTSSVLAATPTAVKAAYDVAAAALPLAGGTVTGNVILDNQVDARFREATANGTNYVGFQAPALVAADVLWTLPAADGTAAQVLSTNGSGTLSWATAAAGATVVDGGNFANGSSIVSTSGSIDGGNFN